MIVGQDAELLMRIRMLMGVVIFMIIMIIIMIIIITVSSVMMAKAGRAVAVRDVLSIVLMPAS